ncbi:UDP-N-acetylmuramoyl-tripeptide--D-alanyl-D-alanine ligase, partial [termite gut metagenome]
MKLEQVVSTIQPIQVIGSKEIEITGIHIDSRLIEPGYLFIAVKGTQTDGHAYIPAAIEKGA